jgi:hypothetical protein
MASRFQPNDIRTVEAETAETSFIVQSPAQRKRTLEPGNTLKRKRKGFPDDPPYGWAVVRDVITAHPAHDSSEYVAVLCEGIGEHSGQWFVWRTYFTNNRHGRLTFGQFGPQAPLAIDKWLNEQICERGWYEKANG